MYELKNVLRVIHMLYVLLMAIISVASESAQRADDTYKILFFSLLGFIVLSGAVYLIYKTHIQLSLFFGNAFSLIKRYISKAYANIKGLLKGPIAGFAYSKEQDIFYSTINAWQRNFGYSRLYDEAAPHFAMIVDSEPVYFNYDNKRWLIEFWKGQYGITTGCEVGVYNTKRPEFNIPGVFDETFYDCASDDDIIYISYTLFKNGQELFSIEDIHWWLTGFKLGEFSQPCELVMDISLTLKDEAMLDAFVEGIRQTGYSNNEIEVNGNTVRIEFNKPHSSQPHSRTKDIEDFMQSYNKQNCELFRKLTGDYNSIASKLVVLQKKAPALYNSILNFGGPKRISRGKLS